MKRLRPGRPSKYNPSESPQWAKRLAMLGATDQELAEAFGISLSTARQWRRQHPEFEEALQQGKLFADAVVASRLFARAIGYQHEDVDIKAVGGKIVKTPIIKRYAPDTTAAIFWLKNRQPALWRDRVPEGVAKDDVQAVPVKITVAVEDARKDGDSAEAE